MPVTMLEIMRLQVLHFALVGVLSAPLLHAQNVETRIVGEVRDPSGAVIPNAVISATDAKTG